MKGVIHNTRRIFYHEVEQVEKGKKDGDFIYKNFFDFFDLAVKFPHGVSHLFGVGGRRPPLKFPFRSIAALLTVVFLLSLPVPGLSAQTTTAEEVKIEFPQWARDLRRGEIIAFGAFPFTMFFSSVVWDTYKWGYYDDFSMSNTRYAPWPIKPADGEALTNTEFLKVMGIAAGAAVLIAITDHILIRIRRARAARQAASVPRGQFRIERKPWPPEENVESPPLEDGASAEEGRFRLGDIYAPLRITVP
jgi:hypothetical protein